MCRAIRLRPRSPCPACPLTASSVPRQSRAVRSAVTSVGTRRTYPSMALQRLRERAWPGENLLVLDCLLLGRAAYWRTQSNSGPVSPVAPIINAISGPAPTCACSAATFRVADPNPGIAEKIKPGSLLPDPSLPESIKTGWPGDDVFQFASARAMARACWRAKCSTLSPAAAPLDQPVQPEEALGPIDAAPRRLLDPAAQPRFVNELPPANGSNARAGLGAYVLQMVRPSNGLGLLTRTGIH